MDGSVIKRFWSKVDRVGGKTPEHCPELGPCWPWNAALGGGGYGACWNGERQTVAHRVSYELEYGPIPDGLLVCHHCDNPRCVKPQHLFLGSTADNVRDKVRKGRARGQAKGEGHSLSKLTAAQVAEMRELYSKSDVTQRALARQFGVARATVGQIVRGERWT